MKLEPLYKLVTKPKKLEVFTSVCKENGRE
jgi:hypothetical protein